MHPLRNFLLLLSIAFAFSSPAFAQTSSDEKRVTITKDATAEFARGDVAAVRGRFSTELKNAVTEEDLKGAREDLVAEAGGFQSQISQSTRKVESGVIYVSKSQFERFKVELKLMFDEADRITEFRIAPLSDQTPEAMEAAARAVADQLHAEQFASVNSKFTDGMKESMSTERLQGSWMHVMTHLGAFKNIRSARKDPESDRVDVRCDFQNGQMIIRVAFDPFGKIGGLWMLPAEPEKDSQI